jgi:hypothetical protein
MSKELLLNSLANILSYCTKAKNKETRGRIWSSLVLSIPGQMHLEIPQVLVIPRKEQRYCKGQQLPALYEHERRRIRFAVRRGYNWQTGAGILQGKKNEQNHTNLP